MLNFVKRWNVTILCIENIRNMMRNGAATLIHIDGIESFGDIFFCSFFLAVTHFEPEKYTKSLESHFRKQQRIRMCEKTKHHKKKEKIKKFSFKITIN